MESAFVVQQRDRRGWTWRTVTGESTHAAATGLADELRHVLDDLPHLPAPPVRVVRTDEIADEARISGHAAAPPQWSPLASNHDARPDPVRLGAHIDPTHRANPGGEIRCGRGEGRARGRSLRRSTCGGGGCTEAADCVVGRGGTNR